MSERARVRVFSLYLQESFDSYAPLVAHIYVYIYHQNED